MRKLADELGETVTLNAYSKEYGTGVCVAIEECDKPLQYALEVGEIKPLHAGASGKALLAFLPDAECERILEINGLPRLTPHTTVRRRKLDAELRATRTQGWVASFGERLAGAVGIGAPVFNVSGHVVASMVVTIPEQRFDQSQLNDYAHSLRVGAGQLSQILGYQGVSAVSARSGSVDSVRSGTPAGSRTPVKAIGPAGVEHDRER